MVQWNVVNIQEKETLGQEEGDVRWSAVLNTAEVRQDNGSEEVILI